MPRLRLLVGLCLLVAVVSVDAGSIPQPPPGPRLTNVKQGHELFTLNFARPDEAKLNRKMATQGNGLGPVYNATSCAGCHQQGGIGGSGGLESNVVTLGIVTRPVA